MLLDEAVDRVVGHLQCSAGANRDQIRAVLEMLCKAGVVHFEPDPRKRLTASQVEEDQLRALLSECERITATKLPRVESLERFTAVPKVWDIFPHRRRTITMPVVEVVERRQAKVDVEDLTAALYYAGYDVVRRRP